MKKLFLVEILCFSALCAPAAYADGNFFNDPFATKAEIHSAAPDVCAAEVSHDKPLALADVVSFALCNNPATKQSWAVVLENAARLGSSRAAYLPTVDGDAGFGYSKNSLGHLGGSTSVTPGVSLNYLLFDFGGREATVDETKQGLIAADYSHNATLQGVVFSAVQAYYQLFAAQSAVDATADNVKAAKASLDAATMRFKVGVATIADQLLAETAYSQAVLKQQQAENLSRTNKGTLANIMGISPDYEFSISAEAPKELNADFSASVADMLEDAKKNRPDLAANAAQVESARANVNVQQAAGLPSISLSASKDYSTTLNGESISNTGSSVGATLHVPFFTGFDNTYQIRQAREELAESSAARDAAENAVLLDVWKTYANFTTAKQSLETTDILLASATKSQEVALGRYKAGVGTITDLLVAQSGLADARQQHVQSQYDWLVAKADLLRALGKIDQKTIGEAP